MSTPETLLGLKLGLPQQTQISSLIESKKVEIDSLIAQSLVTPSYRLKINYVDIDEFRVPLLFPFRPKILRFSRT